MVFALAVLPLLISARAETTQKLTDFVDPFIGTGTVGHKFPGATTPFGLVQLSPDTGTNGWKWCGGYHSDDDSLLGFSHTHLSGTGGLDFLNILFVPQVGDVKWEAGNKPDGKGYRTTFHRDSEKASPGYYAVTLANGIRAELTASPRAGIHRYTFPEGSAPSVLIDLWHHNGNPTKTILDAGVYQEAPDTIVGWQSTGSGAKIKTFYFFAKFSRLVRLEARKEQKEGAVGPMVKAAIYPEAGAAPLVIKVGLSPTGIEGARRNLATEVGNRGFEAIRAETESVWEKALQKIRVTSTDPVLLRIFYTGLYHTMIAPNLYNDVDGTFVGADLKVHPSPRFDYYSTLSLWDTFRSVHPLFTIISPETVAPILKSMVDHGERALNNILPIWTLCSIDVFAMIGYHSAPVLLDAYTKGIRDFDAKRALGLMVNTANRRTRKDHQTLGYMPSDGEWKRPAGVSVTLETAYDDWCIAQFARRLGDDAVADEFTRRSEFYMNVWHPTHRFMWGKDKDGKWMEPFDPYTASHRYFTEGNAWQWMWSVMHNIRGIIELIGGNEAAAQRLEEMFVDRTPVKSDSPDVTGLLGQYCQGNEPSHHIAYLFSYAGQPWRTQYWVNCLVRTFYNDTREGLCGNDDCGAMSSWLVFSALGFYPVNPASSIYIIGSPMFERAEIQTPQTGKTFTLVANPVSKKNIYIQSAKLNGEVFNRPWITHDELTSGATLEFEMGSEPNKNWGVVGPIPQMAHQSPPAK